jgi:hypothetical protein
MIKLATNGRGRPGRPVIFPGDTPEERYEWCIAHMSLAEKWHMVTERMIRRDWIRVHNPDALKAAA